MDIRSNTFAVISNTTDGTILSKLVVGRIETESNVEINEDFSQLSNVLPFPLEGEECKANELYNDSSGNWVCVQTHLRTIYPPIDTPALFRLYRAQGEEWTQPLNEFDAYYIGDWVTFEGSSYTSIIDSNVWSPTGYPAGWELRIEEI